MLKDEVQSVQTLDHKHVVKYFEFNENATWAKKSGERVSVAYIVSELVHGGELFDRLLDRGSFTEQDAAVILQQLLAALEYCPSILLLRRP